eukprot:350984-Chlamydomonas_euryale.AAC.3
MLQCERACAEMDKALDALNPCNDTKPIVPKALHASAIVREFAKDRWMQLSKQLWQLGREQLQVWQQAHQLWRQMPWHAAVLLAVQMVVAGLILVYIVNRANEYFGDGLVNAWEKLTGATVAIYRSLAKTLRMLARAPANLTRTTRTAIVRRHWLTNMANWLYATHNKMATAGGRDTPRLRSPRATERSPQMQHAYQSMSSSQDGNLDAGADNPEIASLLHELSDQMPEHLVSRGEVLQLRWLLSSLPPNTTFTQSDLPLRPNGRQYRRQALYFLAKEHSLLERTGGKTGEYMCVA